MIDSKKRLFKKEYATELLVIAGGDLESALNLADKMQTGRPENIVFLAQQSVKKCIKSVLVHLQIAFPLVHNLGILIALLPDEKIPPNGFTLTELNPYASVRRYEEGHLSLTVDEISAALKASKEVSAWAQAEIKKRP